jgi:hypothetical protein
VKPTPICLAEATAQNLFVGKVFTGISIERDVVWPQMWRVRKGDELSDLANLARIKDAAISWARPKGLGGDEIVRWHRREKRAGAPSMRSGRRAA